MAAPNTSNAELGRKIDGVVEMLGAMGQRINAIEAQQTKVIEAIYGNGGPGIKEQLRNHEATIKQMNLVGGPKVRALDEDVKSLLTTHQECNISEVQKQLEKITARHDNEDKGHAEQKAVSLENRRENRKMFLALGLTVATSIAMTLLNLIYQYLNVLPPK